MNLRSIPPHIPFLDALAAWWLETRGDDPLAVADGLFLLPTRRAARALVASFLGVAQGRPLLLPRIAALGALDEAPLALSGALTLPPAVPEATRLAVLTRLVMQLEGRFGAPGTADRAWPLAMELAALLDEAHRAEVDLHTALPLAAAVEHAAHWERTIQFLTIVTEAWPAWLRDNGMMDAAARGVALLDAQGAAWAGAAPGHPVVVAGTTGGIAAVARLIRTVARMQGGLVVLPGVDLGMPDALWDGLRDGHPQAGLRRLLSGLGATRGDVVEWPEPATAVPAARDTVLRRALLPAEALGTWRGGDIPLSPRERVGVRVTASTAEAGHGIDPHPDPLPEGEGAAAHGRSDSSLSPRERVGVRVTASTAEGGHGGVPHPNPLPEGEGATLAGLQLLEPADQQEEAVAIALALRDALEEPGARAALVTPDRQLAGRVAAELLRFGVVVDDSAGENLADTPPGAFLRLLARVVADGFAPVLLLSVLKHPLAALGLTPFACRQAARLLERACLRGPAPAPGLDGLRDAVGRTARPDLLLDLLSRLDAAFAPILRIAARTDATPADALRALIETAEAVARTDAAEGAALWSGEEGDALAQHLSALLDALPILPPQPVMTLPGLLEASMAGAVVRSRRALRGREGAEHPRVAILGLLEARLQSAELLVLGGLVEGVWPPITESGPWMSRPMRAAAGLPSPEERVGQMAHDFAMLCSAAPRVVLSCPRRRDGAPAVPARWLTRLAAYLAGQGTALPVHPGAAWAQALDQPPGPPVPARPPRPRPALQDRPRRLSVTEVETWLRDPYAIYARHVLRLRALDPLEQSADAADYGSIVHAAIAAFLAGLPATYPPRAASLLRAQMLRALAEGGFRPALMAWWRPRLLRIADWAADAERDRRLAEPRMLVRSEVSGVWDVPGTHPFQLTGRADRIERRPDGGLAILDYKTGAVPAESAVEQGHAPQLPLEAAMAAAGVFGADLVGRAAELTYWHLTGGFVPGEVKRLFKGDATRTADAADAAQASLMRLVRTYDDPARAYLSQPHPGAAPRFSDYAQLARVAEWAALEDGS